MLAFFSQIIDGISLAVRFVGMILQSLFFWITYIPQFSRYLFELFSWLPQPFATFAVAGFAASLFIFLMGRST